MTTDVLTAASGRWREILEALAGLRAEQLSNRHQPCPACGGRDRYRFDDKDGSGSWFSNQCGGKDHLGGGGTGMDLLMRVRRWTFRQACEEVERYLGLEPGGSGRHRPQAVSTGNGGKIPTPALGAGVAAAVLLEPEAQLQGEAEEDSLMLELFLDFLSRQALTADQGPLLYTEAMAADDDELLTGASVDATDETHGA
jgi:hypothetical protein